MNESRREFLKRAGAAAALAAVGGWSWAEAKGKPLNVLLFTADDLNCDSVGAFGGLPRGLTPNLDKFAAQGMRFDRAHVNVGICMPSRAVIGTGLYAHNSGAMGFMHARPGTPNVIDLFRAGGYATGILGKIPHSTPCENGKWDYAFGRAKLGDGRSPKVYYERSKTFFNQCKQQRKPFYFMVNSHDPHRPFHTAGRRGRGSEEPSKTYKSKDVSVPGFLPDLPGVRKEFSTYLNSVRRCDDTFGTVMKALDESGFASSTIVMFLSDNGIAMPFAKCNCYLAGTRTPWIVRWPGVTKPGSVDKKHFISGIDFLPTVLEATGLRPLKKQDGQSFVPLLKRKKQSGRDWVYTQIDSKSGNGFVPMRCVQNGKYGYIYNGWSDGKTMYRNANEGRTFKAMEAAAKTDPAIAERVKMFRYRVPEELYDLEKDPDCLKNLVKSPKHRQIYGALTKQLESWMVKTGDPMRDAFVGRANKNIPARRKALRKAQRPGSRIKPIPRPK